MTWLRQHRRLLLLLLLLLSCVHELVPHHPPGDAVVAAKVVGVTDGDTITVLTADQQRWIIRLYGVDCPERRQAFGSRAKQFTADLVFSQSVTLELHEKDRYHRQVASVTLADGRDLAALILEAGFGWWSQKYAPQRHDYQALETTARQAKRGLWRDPHPTPPYQFRRSHPRSKKPGLFIDASERQLAP